MGKATGEDIHVKHAHSEMFTGSGKVPTYATTFHNKLIFLIPSRVPTTYEVGNF
ncbi:hypothetical protein PHLCEN_2v326 [Hermanssonia centrifuga]|uniref:Uncharacterized protein n=1 Tax=Hermanssonia centrifuga TaxID=98765 RepID=A0A2R6S6E5_9APHY|nr:hypothetical protein PHLCEN_2v326 [Hermanssonia centrifuga]